MRLLLPCYSLSVSYKIVKILNNLGTSFLNIILVIFNKRKKVGKYFFGHSLLRVQNGSCQLNIGISKVRMDIILGSLFLDLPCNRSPFNFEGRSLANENVCFFIHSSHSSELNLNGFWYMLSISPVITISRVASFLCRGWPFPCGWYWWWARVNQAPTTSAQHRKDGVWTGNTFAVGFLSYS